MRIYTQASAIVFCGTIEEVRQTLANHAKRYRTIRELIEKTLN